ncbi:HAD family hydrolase [Polaromonas sp.]|uniref:HAD family hydrolase n=1 Tax=Polaromonas sp. TaxID=1869339 RepID=UPI003565849E
MLDLTIIKAISLDLDDTLWPVWPVIERAEAALDEWLGRHAPMTAALFADPTARHDVREQIARTRPELKHNLSAIRREAIRLALYRSKENPLLADDAFEVFFEARHQVTLYDDAMLALQFLSARYPIVALSNGNADIARVGLGPYFRAAISAQQFGVGKPDPRIFHAAAGAVNVDAHNVLHVGDDATLDVLGGLSAGMQTAWVNRADHLWTHDASPHETVTTLTELCDMFRAAEEQA